MTTKRKGQTKRKADAIEWVTQLRFFWRGLAHGWADTLRNWEERLDTDYERCRHFLRKTTGHLQTVSCPRNDDYRCPRRVEQNEVRPGVFSYQAVCGKRMEPEDEFEEYCDTLTLAPEQVEFWQLDREELLTQISQATRFTSTPPRTYQNGEALHVPKGKTIGYSAWYWVVRSDVPLEKELMKANFLLVWLWRWQCGAIRKLRARVYSEIDDAARCSVGYTR